MRCSIKWGQPDAMFISFPGRWKELEWRSDQKLSITCFFPLWLRSMSFTPSVWMAMSTEHHRGHTKKPKCAPLPNPSPFIYLFDNYRVIPSTFYLLHWQKSSIFQSITPMYIAHLSNCSLSSWSKLLLRHWSRVCSNSITFTFRASNCCEDTFLVLSKSIYTFLVFSLS